MRNDTVESFLQALSDRSRARRGRDRRTAPAQAAALVAMVARYSDSAAFAAHAETMGAVRTAADDLRHDALTLTEKDMTAFTTVTDAYCTPHAEDDRERSRSADAGHR